MPARSASRSCASVASSMRSPKMRMRYSTIREALAPPQSAPVQASSGHSYSFMASRRRRPASSLAVVVVVVGAWIRSRLTSASGSTPCTIAVIWSSSVLAGMSALIAMASARTSISSAIACAVVVPGASGGCGGCGGCGGDGGDGGDGGGLWELPELACCADVRLRPSSAAAVDHGVAPRSRPTLTKKTRKQHGTIEPTARRRRRRRCSASSSASSSDCARRASRERGAPRRACVATTPC